MPAARRVTARDIANAGGLDSLIKKYIEGVRSGNMESKERAATALSSLTGQPMFDGQTEENAELIALAGGIVPLVALVQAGSPKAQTHACAALAVMASKDSRYAEEIVTAGGLAPITNAVRTGDAAVQQHAVSLLSSVSRLISTQQSIIKAGVIPTLVALLKGSASNETLVHSSFTLANLANNNPDGQNRIAKAGAIPMLMGLLEAGKALV